MVSGGGQRGDKSSKTEFKGGLGGGGRCQRSPFEPRFLLILFLFFFF